MRRPPPVSTAAVAAALAFALTACGGSPAPTPSPSAVPLRAVEACPATVVVPTDAERVLASASEPPTVVLSVGGAVSFPIARGARVGVVGDPEAAEDAGLCAAPGGTAATATYVATAAGYLRLAVQVGVQSPERVFVRVTAV